MEHFRRIVDRSLQGHVVLQGGRIIYANEAISRISGYANAELLQMDLAQMGAVVHPDDRDWVLAGMAKIMSGEEDAHHLMFRFIRKDGSIRWVEIFSSLVTNHDGPAIQVSYSDITEQRNSRELQAAQLRLLNFTPEYRIQDLIQQFQKEAANLAASESAFFYFVSSDGNILSGNSGLKDAGIGLTFEERAKELALALASENVGPCLIDEKVLMQCLTNRRPVIHNFYEGLAPIQRRVDESLPVQRAMVLPILRHRNVVAIWGVVNKSGMYQAEEFPLLQQLADFAWELIERRLADKVAEQHAAEFIRFAESSPAVIYRLQTEPTFRLDYVNRAVERIVGYSPDELRANSELSLQILHPEEQSEIPRGEADLIETGPMPIRCRHRDGHAVWLEHQLTVMRDRHHGVTYVEGIAVDATEKMEKTRALEESEARFRALSDESWDAVAFHRNGVLLDVNEAFCRLFGYARDELIGAQSMALLLRGESAERVREHIASHARDPIRVRMYRKDGSPLTIESQGRTTVYRGEETRVICLRNVTDNARILLNLRASEQKYRELADCMDDAFVLLDKEMKYLFWNRRCAEMFGVSQESMVGVSYYDFERNSGYEWIGKRYIQVMETDVPQRFEAEFMIDSRSYVFGIHAYPTPSGCAVLMNDVTEQRQAEQRLRSALAENISLKEKLSAENMVLRDEMRRVTSVSGIVGQSKSLRTVLAGAEQVAKVDSTVLLLGETGTGKELLARAIHDWSSRRGAPMISVNCASIPTSLTESELFGREKGAFTGSLSRQMGRFEAANGGTLFLDEVGEIPLDIQTKLLRVIEEGVFERLGSNVAQKVNVRILAATNRNLEDEVNRGNFREDLFYRLNVFPLMMPPLRERKEDIPELVWHFVRYFGELMGKFIEVIRRTTIKSLQEYHWPGNIRELRNIVERAMIMTSGSTLNIDLPSDTVKRPTIGLRTLDELQRHHIEETLRQTGWRIRGHNGAAEILGMKPTTLESRMRKLNIVRP